MGQHGMKQPKVAAVWDDGVCAEKILGRKVQSVGRTSVVPARVLRPSVDVSQRFLVKSDEGSYMR